MKLLRARLGLYVYLNNAQDAALRAKALKLFEDKAREPNSGIGRVLRQAEISTLGGDPEAFLALDAAPGVTFGAGYGGEYDAPLTVKAMHGYDPNRPDMRASLVLYGPGIEKGKLRDARLIDIAPTVASWLQLPLTAEGKPLQAQPGAPSAAPAALSVK